MWPDWLVLGVGGGMLAAMAVALIFSIGSTLYPTIQRPPSISGEHKRRAEIRRYLTEIGEPFAEDHPISGQPVEFYLPLRDVAITFDARAYFRIEDGPTYAVLVEHEMPGTQLGGRLPFETPPVRGDPADPRGAACALLGVPSDAPLEEIKRAYREQVKEAHPDLGGDREAFERLREAYTTAKGQ